jgi:hypothetical protein
MHLPQRRRGTGADDVGGDKAAALYAVQGLLKQDGVLVDECD